MVTFKINDIDISNDVIVGSFNYMTRIDDVYGQGSLQFESKTITENIPPYSILQVNDDYYCCSSEATYHFGNKSWFHNVSVIEITSLLSRYLLGTKAFSNTGTNRNDWEKVNIILELIKQKYNINFSWLTDINTLFTSQNEYQFGAGTTLFDALDEICTRYNYRIVVKKYANNIINLDLINISANNLVDTSELSMLSMTKTQNPETYCDYLETEATNVVEKDTLQVINNIYPTANEIKLSEDTLVFKAPTPIYKVVSFKRKINDISLQILLKTDRLAVGDYPYDKQIKTFGEWNRIYPTLNGVYEILLKYFTGTKIYNSKWYALGDTLKPYNSDVASQPMVAGELRGGTYYFDYSNRILSKEQYDLLEDKDKPDYAYYTFGSNVIDGFNVYYKNDFWNDIIGTSKDPFILQFKYEDSEYQGKSFSGWKFEKYYTSVALNPLNSSYDLTYYAMANPYVSVSKNKTSYSVLPLNEDVYKPYSISFNKSGNTIDFDKLHQVMVIENLGMGIAERVVEYVAPLNHQVQYFGTLYLGDFAWYINTCDIRYDANQKIIKYGVKTTPTNKADSVVLNSQYNTLKNPVEGIIERPIYLELDDKFTFEKGTTYVKLATYDNNKNIITNKLYFKPIIYTHKNDIYFYFEMLDQYSAGQNATLVKDNLYKVNDVAYADSNNEVLRIQFAFADMSDLTVDDIRLLPYSNIIGTGTTNIYYSTIYKDAREKLTFTIKANNCIIK